MTDIAIRVENCILSRVEGLSKLYRIGKSPYPFQRFNVRTFQRSNDDYVWALRDVSFESLS
jgi:hypothetical protein